MNTDTVFVFSEEGSARIVQNAGGVLVPHPWQSDVPFWQPMPLWSLVCWQVYEYVYRRSAISVPTHVPDFPMLVSRTLIVPAESNPPVDAAPADPIIDAVAKEPLLREVFALLPTAVAVPIDNVPVHLTSLFLYSLLLV